MHDARGKELKVGDLVMIPAVVSELYQTEDFCNLSLTTQIGRRPDGQKEQIYAINTGVVIKIAAGDE